MYSPPPSSPPLLPAIPGIVSAGLIFPFTYMCAQLLHHIHPSTPFPCHLPPPTGTNLPTRQDLSALLVSDFIEEKRRKKE
jgi:hypothetical protein